LAKFAGDTAMRNLGDIVAYNREHAASALRYGQTLLEQALYTSSGRMTEPAYLEALAFREKVARETAAAMDEARADVVLCKAFTNIAPFIGAPCVSIPLGVRADGLPIGSYWMARPFDEATLLRVAYAAEKALGLTVRPRGLPQT
jgi:amidase